MKKTIILLAIISIAFISCKKDKKEDPTPTPVEQKNFEYIKTGAKWIFISSDTDPNHAGITFEQSFTITAKDADGWCNIDWALPTFTQHIEWFSDVTMFSNMASKASQFKFPLIKANPVLNDSYTMDYTSNGVTYTNKRQVVSLSESITVPAGTFTNCVKIHETTTADNVYYKDYWIDKTYGIVRTEGTTQGDYPVIIIEELKSKP
jgi:hypothetical protein